MRKQKLSIGLLICAMCMAHAFGMHVQLDTLRDRLNDLRDALAGQEVSPPPPLRIPGELGGEVLPTGQELPPPPPPLPPGAPKPPTPPPGLIPPPLKPIKPAEKPAIKPTFGPENVPPVPSMEEPVVKPGEMKAQLEQKLGVGVAEKPKKPLKIVAPGMEVPTLKPTIKIKPTQELQAKTEVPKLEITMVGHVPQYMAILGAMPMETTVDKAKRKAYARGIMNGILGWVNKKQVDKNAVMPVLDTLLSVDPLLISTAALVLDKVGASQAEIYKVMIKLYQNRVGYIGKEIDKLKESKFAQSKVPGQVYAGIREDIDDAVSYPIELESALQHAKNLVVLGGPNIAEAQNFIKQMADLKIQLCRYIMDNLELFDPMYREFYRSFCAEGAKPEVVYCKLELTKQQKKDKTKTYISIQDAITDVLARIESFNAHKDQYWESKRTFEIQYIVNTLVSFIDFFTCKDFCVLCLQHDIYKMEKKKFPYKAKLQEIKSFLRSVADSEQNDFLRLVADREIPRLEQLLEEQKGEAMSQAEFLEEEGAFGPEEGYGSEGELSEEGYSSGEESY